MIDVSSQHGNCSVNEVEYAKRWMYRKGILTPQASTNAEYVELDSFLDAVLNGTKPKADIEVGLQDSMAVMLSNLAMDEERKIYFQRSNYMQNGGRIEVAQELAGHESARTTGLYNRADDAVSLDEIERILI